jgi:hypothetical protein
MTSRTRNPRSTTTEEAYGHMVFSVRRQSPGGRNRTQSLAERDTLAIATSDKTGGRS